MDAIVTQVGQIICLKVDTVDHLMKLIQFVSDIRIVTRFVSIRKKDYNFLSNSVWMQFLTPDAGE